MVYIHTSNCFPGLISFYFWSVYTCTHTHIYLDTCSQYEQCLYIRITIVCCLYDMFVHLLPSLDYRDYNDVLTVCDWDQKMSFYLLNGKQVLHIRMHTHTLTYACMHTPSHIQVGKDRNLDYDPTSLSYFSSGDFSIMSGSHSKVSTSIQINTCTITGHNYQNNLISDIFQPFYRIPFHFHFARTLLHYYTQIQD